jgi:hypothetical protein
MGYLHIQNLYKDQTVLLFKSVYALEKIHGTSAHVSFDPADGSIRYFSGGTSHSTFVSLFNEDSLIAGFKALALPADKKITIYGESYGGKEQGMSLTYGKVGKFVAFDVQIGESWLAVPEAEKIVQSLGLEFIHYSLVTTDIDELDRERDKPSTQAKRNGVMDDKPAEGVVLRPLKEMTLNNGARVIAKHKREEFRETATARSVETDPAKLKVLADAEAVADEWMTAARFANARSHFKPEEIAMENMPALIKYLVDDILREGEGEIIVTQEVRKAISRRAAKIVKEYLVSLLNVCSFKHEEMPSCQLSEAA